MVVIDLIETIPLVTGQLWSLSTTSIQVRLRIQLNTILYAKTLVRKDVASGAPQAPSTTGTPEGEPGPQPSAAPESDAEKKDEDDFSSKAQIMTLMTTDVDRVSDFAWHVFSLVGKGTLNLCLRRPLIGTPCNGI